MFGVENMYNINILVCSDKNYIMPTAVLLKSLSFNICSNDKSKYKLTTYILNSDLSDGDIKNIENIVNEKNIKILSLKINEEDFKGLKVSGHISKSAYYRILASDVLPNNIDRVLYLDCDIIINGSIKDFYFQDFDGKALIACEDKVISHNDLEVYKNLNLDINDKYFNSGVILFNIELLRQIPDFKSKMFNFINANKENFIFHDQDILNGFFKDKVKFDDDFIYNNLVKWIRNRKELKEAYKNTVIFHYADRWKPWKYNYIGYCDDLFWKYACMAGYNEFYKEYKRKHFIYKFIPFNILRKIKRLIF